MKSLEELINHDEPGSDLVRQWADSAKNQYEVLPPSPQRDAVLLKVQVTTRSPLGAVAHEIEDDHEGPAYVFSVGIHHTLAMPGICIFGLSDARAMGRIINDIGDLMRSGTEFKDWHAKGAV